MPWTVGAGFRAGFFRVILKLIVFVSMVSEVTSRSSVPVELFQLPTFSNGNVSPNGKIVKLRLAGVSEPVIPMTVTVTSHAAKSGTVLFKDTEIAFSAHGTDVLWMTVLTLKTGSQMYIGAASPALPRGTGMLARS
jgi:hypothetical protein